ncbi:threonine dehydratase [Aquabacterium sp. A7-Y]|uniref:threonine dehydratase n=1 Tax=Aquabacterium sp. A7-Y TaxID=1349605 RepID=UPI00223DE1B8|nr:threonine dehydratase [Aquabacterium sp. A7-Y]MCW7539560.1 threonine dehydratase [Aquabacterium sp. A7-Y]
MSKPYHRARLQAAQETVYAAMPPTPQYAWPLLARRLGAEVWVKHENHTPVGAFKVRGGLVYVERLKRQEPQLRGLISATRGNHGQSLGYAARRHGLAATIVVPHGNSIEKNAAMRELGVRLIEHGEDFQAAREHAVELAEAQGLHMVPSFHPDLVCGVATGWIEFFEAVQPEVLFVPVGMGSGLCAAAAARAYTGARTRLIGVVSAHAPAYRLSFQQGRVVEAAVATQLADGMACRSPDAEAVAMIRAEADDMVAVDDTEVAAAMRALFADTHNVAEGAGAAALAAALQQRERWQGRKVGIALTGGNVDSGVFARVLGA